MRVMKSFKEMWLVAFVCFTCVSVGVGQEQGKIILCGKFGNAFLEMENKELQQNNWWLKENASGVTEQEIPIEMVGKRMFLHLEGGKMTQLIVPSSGRVVVTFSENKTFVFSGDHERINNYLREWSEAVFNSVDNIYACSFALLPLFSKKVPSPGDIYAPENLSKIVNGLEIETKRLADAGIEDPGFVKEQEVYVRYHQTYSRLRNMAYALEGAKGMIPESEWHFYEELDFDDPDMRLYFPACSLIGTYFVVERKSGRRNTDYAEDLHACASRIGDVTLREAYVLQQLETLERCKMVYLVDEIITSVKPLIVSEDACLRLEELEKEFSRLEKMYPGMGEMMSEAKLVDVNGRDFSLKELRGKYVFIDFWATWCGACRQMTPRVKELALKFADENIAFVFVSIDEFPLKNNVFQYAAEHDITECTYIVKNKKEWKEQYLLQSIPRFMLLNPDGRIVSTNFLWPNHDLLPLHLKKLLEAGERR